MLILCLLQTLHLRARTIFPLAITILHSSHMTLLNSLLRSCFHFLNIKLNVLQLSSAFCGSIIIFIHLFILSFHYLFTITNAWLLSMDISIFISYHCFLYRKQLIATCYFELCTSCSNRPSIFKPGAGCRLVHAWFLKIIVSVRTSVGVCVCLCVCVCVCRPPRLSITSGTMWHDTDPMRLIKKVLQLLYGNCSHYR